MLIMDCLMLVLLYLLRYSEWPHRAVLSMISPMTYLSNTILCIVAKERIIFLDGAALNASHMSFRCTFILGLGCLDTWATIERISDFYFKATDCCIAHEYRFCFMRKRLSWVETANWCSVFPNVGLQTFASVQIFMPDPVLNTLFNKSRIFGCSDLLLPHRFDPPRKGIRG